MRKPLLLIAVLLFLGAGGVSIWIANRPPKVHVNPFVAFHYASTVEHYTLVETPLPEDIHLPGHYTIYVRERPLVSSFGIAHIEKGVDLDGKPSIFLDFTDEAADTLQLYADNETDYLLLMFDSRILLLSPLNQNLARKTQITMPDVAERDELYDLLTGDALPHVTWGAQTLEQTHANRKCIYREYEHGARVVFWLSESGTPKYRNIIVLDETDFLVTTVDGFFPEGDLDKEAALRNQRKQKALEREMIWIKKKMQEEKQQLEQEAAQQPPE